MANATKITQLVGALVLVATCAGLVGCNTVAGAGQDIKAGGNAVTNSAEKVKNSN